MKNLLGPFGIPVLNSITAVPLPICRIKSGGVASQGSVHSVLIPLLSHEFGTWF